MKPIEFEGHNVVFAKDQPEYMPLPAFKDPSGGVVTCWELTPEERLELFNTGKLWIKQLTFNQPLQPVIASATPLVEYFLTVSYLKELHQELTLTECQLLLDFCKENTIQYRSCYGNGSIMFPKWVESLKK
jgi:hypothetical protein